MNAWYGQTFKFCQSDSGEMIAHCALNFNFLDCSWGWHFYIDLMAIHVFHSRNHLFISWPIFLFCFIFIDLQEICIYSKYHSLVNSGDLFSGLFASSVSTCQFIFRDLYPLPRDHRIRCRLQALMIELEPDFLAHLPTSLPIDSNHPSWAPVPGACIAFMLLDLRTLILLPGISGFSFADCRN